MAPSGEPLNAGWDHYRAGRLPEAEQLARRCLARGPRDAHAFHLLGSAPHAGAR